VITYVVSGAWVGMTSFCALPIVLFVMLRSICVNEIQLRDYWYLDNYCLNLSRFGQLHVQFCDIVRYSVRIRDLYRPTYVRGDD